jgi:hypothetical protein
MGQYIFEEGLWLRREMLYNILIEFQILLKLVRLIKMHINETYSKIHIGKNLSDAFPIQNGLTQWDALSPTIAFQLCFRICHLEGLRKTGRTGTEWNTSAPGLDWQY